MITNRYVIPVLVAAAVHAALLMAFPGGPPPSGETEPESDTRKYWKVPDEVFIVPSQPAQSNSAQNSSGDPVRSLPADPAPLTKSDFTVPTPPVFEPKQAIVTDRIPVNPNPFADGGPNDGRDGGVHSSIVSLDMLDRSPRVRSQIEPVYPFDMRRDATEGMVEVAFVVGKDGTVTHAYAEKSSHRAFEEPALNAVRKWRFEPGRSHGRVVSFRMSVQLHFRITDG